MEEKLTQAVLSALTKLEIEATDIEFEHPAELVHGDFSSNVAMRCAKQAGKNPRELAQEIVDALEDVDDVEKIEVAGPGFINFHLNRDFFTKSIQTINEAGEEWGSNTDLSDKTIMVEYTDPNPFKPFHIGHLMSNAIGEAIARTIEASGAETVRANYQGDVGLHVGKALWGLKDIGGDPANIDDLARGYAHGHARYEEDENAKAEIMATNKAVYALDGSIKEAYETGRTVTLERFEELYKILGTKFVHYFFESQCVEPGTKMVEEGKANGIFEESDGAIVFHGKNYNDKLHTRVFLTKENLPTYEAKELGLQKLKREACDYDISITITADEQTGFFKVVYEALYQLDPFFKDKLKHVPHGMMQLTSGKMSSRKGNVVTGESLLNDMIEMATEKVAERDLPEEDKAQIAQEVAVAAIKYSILRQFSGKNISFDPEQSLSFEGDSGPYLQYAHTRALSVLEKAERENVSIGFEQAPTDISNLEKVLYRFPEIVKRAREEYEPHYLTTYLTELASEFNSWYAHEQILDGSPESPYKLALTRSFAITMEKGLWLLGIRAPKRM